MKGKTRLPKTPEGTALLPPSREVRPPRLWELPLVIGEGALALIVNLVVMVLVERSHGQGALGIYTYLLSFYHLLAYGAEFGVPRYLERETALNPVDSPKQAQILIDAFQAVLCMGIASAGFCFLSAAYDTSFTQIQEKMAAYFIIGLAIPVRNLNKLRMAALHGQGHHQIVARLEGRKHLVFLITILALLASGIAPSYLVLSFPAGELALLAAGRRRLKLPALRSTQLSLGCLRATLKEGSRYLFTDDPLRVVLYIDILILGIFFAAWDVGVYAEAAVLARFFLLVPLSVRPVFRRRFCVAVTIRDEGQISRLANKAAIALFFLHSLLALFMLLFYAETAKLFFLTQGEELISLQIFRTLVPGLLLCASVMASEPLYEALGLVDSLRKLVFTVFFTNLALNLYLVPSEGLLGAALATSISMVLYFLLFGRHFAPPYHLEKGLYLLAGGTVYVLYVILQELDIGMALTVCLLPILVTLPFYCIGLFQYHPIVLEKPIQGGGDGKPNE